MGLFPDQKHGGANVNIGGPVGENAEDTGIQVTFDTYKAAWTWIANHV
jgi:hypothetical protein